MKRIILVGSVACGKTTLCQRLNGLEQIYKKTQALEVINHTIDTPGEYLEHRSSLQALVVTSVETEEVLFVQDAAQERFMFSPGQSAAFSVPVAGVVSKADAATSDQIRTAGALLALAGASPVFVVSARTGQGMEALARFLEDGALPVKKEAENG